VSHEEWRLCPGGFYAVSDRGEVRREIAAQGTQAGRVLVPRIDAWGYPVVTLSQANAITVVPVHRLVAEAFLGERPQGLQINHRNGIKADSRAANLEYVSCSENNRHAYRNGLRRRGRKLTPSDVHEIRRRRGQGERLAAIAADFGVTASTVSLIAKGLLWKDCEVHP
jgi:hypothetical protein